MSLSTLTVLVAVRVGGVLQGAIGAILILPLVALYPIVERTVSSRETAGGYGGAAQGD